MFVPSNGSAHSFNIIINKTLQARKKKNEKPKAPRIVLSIP